ncbi:helix-turn-helix transcriptional regulator [Parvibaculaceae bacterium PLY_AMNH_Bact1]|nr:helix-turn-helix transcriptional regulator [Parvibaculaceae bacterium PLY_AMNH_Bact1]
MGNNIEMWRKQKGLTRKALAEAVGCGETQIVKLERGERRLTETWMTKISDAMEITVAELIDPEANPVASDKPPSLQEKATFITLLLLDNWEKENGVELGPRARAASFAEIYEVAVGREDEPEAAAKALQPVFDTALRLAVKLG